MSKRVASGPSCRTPQFTPDELVSTTVETHHTKTKSQTEVVPQDGPERKRIDRRSSLPNPCRNIDSLLPSHRTLARLAHQLSPGQAAAVDHPSARFTAHHVRRRRSRRDTNLLLREASHGSCAHDHARLLPPRPVAVAGRERVCDLVQDRLPNALRRVQNRQWSGQRDHPACHPATSKTPARVIKTKPPHAQAVVAHELVSHSLSGREVHDTKL